jgi:hypothetical protein
MAVVLILKAKDIFCNKLGSNIEPSDIESSDIEPSEVLSSKTAQGRGELDNLHSQDSEARAIL